MKISSREERRIICYRCTDKMFGLLTKIWNIHVIILFINIIKNIITILCITELRCEYYKLILHEGGKFSIKERKQEIREEAEVIVKYIARVCSDAKRIPRTDNLIGHSHHPRKQMPRKPVPKFNFVSARGKINWTPTWILNAHRSLCKLTSRQFVRFAQIEHGYC